MTQIYNPSPAQSATLFIIGIALLALTGWMVASFPGTTTATATVAITLLAGIMSTLYIWLRTM